jgi:polyisoprenoid-binding protein YceI/rhodanese-related sulfurtransferase
MEIQNITPDELSLKIVQGKKFFLIDTLPEEHFQKVRLPGSRNACVYKVNFLSQVKHFTDDPDADIVLCGASHRSRDAEVAAGKLQQAGYRRIAVLRGGLEAWRAAGQALEGSDPDAIDDPLTLLSLKPGVSILDVERSAVGWTGRNGNTTHTGSVRFVSGRIDASDVGFTGRLIVDMTSIENHNLAGDPLQAVLVDHLKSDDFFLVAHFPEATLTIGDARLREKPYCTAVNCDIEGDLSLRGVSRKLSFPATITATADGIGLEAHFDLDRTEWGIIYGSARFFEHLGIHQVFEAIGISLRLVLVRAD